MDVIVHLFFIFAYNSSCEAVYTQPLSKKNNTMIRLSLVIPCFNEEEVLHQFFSETEKVLELMGITNETEYVFIDDGSTDQTLPVLKKAAEENENIHYISFSRNFGKEAAIYAGLEKSRGEYVALMDADLQDPPALLPDMMKAVTEEGFECAAARRVNRKNEPIITSFFARMFYKMMARISNIQVVDGARDFRMMTRKYVNAVLSLTEKNRFSKGIFSWIGFKTKWFEYENVERAAGTTKWSFWSLFIYSIDGIIGFSTKPLAFIALTGICSMFISIMVIIWLTIRKLVYNNSIEGWTSTIIIILFIGGLQLFAMGVLGQYISKMFTEIKQRPIYIVKEEK